jgi:hypothetical protein
MSEYIHRSDCAVNNEPALPWAPCNCGVLLFRCLRPGHVDVYDEHVLASDYDGLRRELAKAVELLRLAPCPSAQDSSHEGQWQCQWCYERKQLIDLTAPETTGEPKL